MEFTGERYLPSEDGKIRLEHYHRYALVSNIVKDKSILDVASGEGYGSFLMSSTAKTVVGVDLSPEAIKYATFKYQSDNLKFLQGSATALNLPDNSFDVVISFETLEHLSQQTEMISELHRVLKPDGFLIISSPNRPIYSEESGEHNEYHVKELDFNELDDLLKQKFGAIQYYGQRMLMGSVIQSLEGAENNYKAWTDDGVNLRPGVPNLVDAVYFIAVCGKAAIDLPKLDMTLLLPEKLDLVKHYVGFAKWAKAQDQQLAKKDQQIAKKDQQIAKKDQQIAKKDQQIAKKDQQIAKKDELEYKLDKVVDLHNAMINSTSWRITLPMREAKLWIFFPRMQIRRYLNALTFRFNRLKNTYKRHHYNLGLVKLFTKGFPSALDPKVSIIIPVYGKVTYTIRCLASILKFLPQASFEIIIVDDCSPDRLSRALRFIKGVRLIANEKNLGFIRSCNAGASIARGEYVYFLNNDTKVTPNFLDALLNTFQNFSNVGLVGSKLIYPDGRLQEAGGIIWRDGSAWNFGRSQDPELPVFNYAREVDYCSGASIMLSREVFKDMKGFDPYYSPAYCEDSDLALKLRANGYRVIYQPLSKVIHFEGVTSGTDLTIGVKSYQVKNLQKQYKRWKHVLSKHQDNGEDLDWAINRRADKRVLVIDEITPRPDQDAGSLLTINMMLLLREMNFQVTFIANNLEYVKKYTSLLQGYGIEVLYPPFIKSIESHLKDHGARYSLVLLYRPQLANRYIKVVRQNCKLAKILYHTVDLHFLRMLREAEIENDESKKIAALKMKKTEFSLIEKVDSTIVVSTEELNILQKEGLKKNIHLLQLIKDSRLSEHKLVERNGIVFLGGFSHKPNVDAVKYFVMDVMPILRSNIKNINFYIIGSNAPQEIYDLEAADIKVIGFIEKLDPFLNKMRVMVAPLRYGAGVKGKVVAAMAIGLPVVATSVAAEGMGLVENENVLIANTPEDLAEKIITLYIDNQLWKYISERSLDFVNANWGAKISYKKLSAILRKLNISVTDSRYDLTLYDEFQN
jgi:GT2 family glycosyltransferase/ubiquinone/menaquinone biosynthesis C-methylase UbiE